MTYCWHPSWPWTGLRADRLGVRIAGNGSYQVVDVCPNCDQQSGPVPHGRLGALGLAVADLAVVADYRGGIGRCCKRGCDREAVEDHHFAPRAAFGAEADEWPRGLLCVEHHIEWHRRMAVE